MKKEPPASQRKVHVARGGQLFEFVMNTVIQGVSQKTPNIHNSWQTRASRTRTLTCRPFRNRRKQNITILRPAPNLLRAYSYSVTVWIILHESAIDPFHQQTIPALGITVLSTTLRHPVDSKESPALGYPQQLSRAQVSKLTSTGVSLAVDLPLRYSFPASRNSTFD